MLLFTDKYIKDDIYNIISKNKIGICFSGGYDSNYLLDYILKYFNIFKKNIYIIYINHLLNNKSKLWEKYIKEICKKRDMNIIYKRVKIKYKYIKLYGLESAARKYRYNCLLNIYLKNKIKYYFLGHNYNDYIENFILRILRGTGIRGLINMKYKTKLKYITLIRPLLSLSRIRMLEINKQKNYIFDNSNINFQYKRNIVRYLYNNILYKYFGDRIYNINRLNKRLYEFINLNNYIAKKDIIMNNLRKNKRIINIFRYIFLKNNIINNTIYNTFKNINCFINKINIIKLANKVLLFKINVFYILLKC